MLLFGTPSRLLHSICSNIIVAKLFINFIFNIVPVSGLKLVMLDVPSTAYEGESVELTCNYELESDKLYSVKWYKNDVEFYRYVPKDWPPGQFLPITGIKVDLLKSGTNSVFLKQIDINTAGTYRCEVSAEAPTFRTAEGEEELKVTVLPLSGPQITGIQQQYKIGDKVSLNCTSAKSKPSAQLKWFINNKEVSPSSHMDGLVYVTNASHVVHDDNLETSSSNLQFIVNEKHFKSSTIRIKCTSTVNQRNTMSNEAILRGERNTSASGVTADDVDDRNLDYFSSDNLLSQSKSSASLVCGVLQSSLGVLVLMVPLVWTTLVLPVPLLSEQSCGLLSITV